MNKKLSLLLTGILCAGLLTGCGKTLNSGFAGTYWLQTPTTVQVPETFYEKIEYKVTTEAEYEGSKLTNLNEGDLYFNLDSNKSSYVTELKSENGVYVYTTTLTMSGEYIFAGEGYVVENDVTTTKTTFKGYEDDFACIKSEKTIKSTLPTVSTPTSKDQFVTINATITTEYGEKNAMHTLTADETSKAYFSSLSEPVTIKKYNKNAYIENDLMLLLARNFSYEDTLSYSFSTIESATGELSKLKIAPDSRSTSTSSESASQSTAFKTLTIQNCQIDNVIRTINFNTFRLKFSTTGEYAQDFTYAYYANSLDSEAKDPNNLSRHYMVKCYKPALYNTQYMVFTIERITH